MSNSSRMLAFGVALSCLVSADPAQARKIDDEVAELQKQVQSLQQGQAKIHQDLEEIKKLLQQGARPAAAAAAAQQAFKPTEISLGDVAYLGSADAPVTLIEFSDYHCPYCKRHADAVMPSLVENYVNSGKLRFVMREYPIERLHPRSVAAAEAALCAGTQGQYWGMHDALFEDQKTTSDEHFEQLAADLGLDLTAFRQCLDGDQAMERIRADIDEGQKLGVAGTPSFVVGLTDPGDPDKVQLTKFIRGAQSLPAFSAAIDELLKKAELP